ncbi:MAG: helix-turn-helix transcriptional regulator [Pseudomonadota bacterium]
MSTIIDRHAFGAQLKAAMDGQGLSYRPVAELIGVSPAQISRAVHGQAIDAGATVALALAFGLPLLDLFDEATRARLVRVMEAQAEADEVPDCANRTAAVATVSPEVSRETCTAVEVAA